MTIEQLRQYWDNKLEIKDLKQRLADLDNADLTVNGGTICDYRTGYPKPQPVVGYDYDLADKRRKRYRDQIAKLEAEQDNIEEWVFGLKDARMRRVYQLRYLDGYTLDRIARKMHMDKSTVCRILNKGLEGAK